MNELKTSEEWYRKLGASYVIIDPDGWDRSNYIFSYYEEQITEEEYSHRVAMSTLIRQLDIEEELRVA